MTKPSPGKSTKPKAPTADNVVYTHVNCDVRTRGLVFYGYKAPGKAIADARRHYQKEMERIQAAIEQLDHNNARVTYMRGGQFIGHEEAEKAAPRVEQ